MIGLFDSGLGGLTVWREVAKVFPDHDLYYLGDTARQPYGNRPPETVYQFTREAVEFLFQQRCELVILACNTASAHALRRLQQEWLPSHHPDKKVLGVIRPLVEEAATLSVNKRVGVLATRGTIASHVYELELAAQNPNITVISQAAPLLVPLIEEGYLDHALTKKVLRMYLHPLKRQQIDTLILGCTHYPLLQPLIQHMMGRRVRVLGGGEIVAAKLRDYLDRHAAIDEKLTKQGQRLMSTTDEPSHFAALARRVVAALPTITQVNIHDSGTSVKHS